MSANPKKGGNSDLLCDEFVRGAIEAGHDVEKIQNRRLGRRRCQGYPGHEPGVHHGESRIETLGDSDGRNMKATLYLSLGCLAAAAICLFLAACAVVKHPRFGALPQGDRLARIERSPSYRDGKFHNEIPTPKFSQDVGMVSVLWSIYFDRSARLAPDTPLPAVKTDLKALAPDADTVVWLGHSSWFAQISGKRILVDPVFSDYAAPFSFMNTAFSGTSIYGAEDMPPIDLLLVSHGHWDHLDHATVTAILSKVKQVVCPLGVGAYFEHWGYPAAKICEGDSHRPFAGNRFCDMDVYAIPVSCLATNIYIVINGLLC